MNMEQNVIQRNIGTPAGMYGLALGIISSAYLLITQWVAMTQMPLFLMMLLNMILWVLKSGGCLLLMLAFMKRFSAEHPQAQRKAVFQAGMIVSILSALVYSAFTFAYTAYLYPDYLAEQMGTLMQQLAPHMDSNTSAAMEKSMQNLPQMTFFSNLIYCFGYGTILSYVISRYIPRDEHPAEYKSEEQ
jgi:flagellar biosynthesis protein FlhB